jgi:hypothetical protein
MGQRQWLYVRRGHRAVLRIVAPSIQGIGVDAYAVLTQRFCLCRFAYSLYVCRDGVGTRRGL